MGELTIIRDAAEVNWLELEHLFQSVGWSNHTSDRISKSFKNSAHISIGFLNGDMIGCGRAVSDDEFYAAIYDVVIDPEFQGKGYGREIINDLLVKLKDISFVHLTATTGKEDFYRKLGLKKHKTAMARYLNADLTKEYLDF